MLNNHTTASASKPESTVPAPPTTGLTRKRFKAGDVAEYFDMLVVGQVCLAISFRGYSQLLQTAFSGTSGSFKGLLAALGNSDYTLIKNYAHSLKGETGSLGLKALWEIAKELEHNSDSNSQSDNNSASQQLLDCWETSQALCKRMGFLNEV